MWGVNITLDLSRKELNASFWEVLLIYPVSHSQGRLMQHREIAFVKMLYPDLLKIRSPLSLY